MKISNIGRGAVVCGAVGVLAVALASGAMASGTDGAGATSTAKAHHGSAVKFARKLEHAQATVRTKQGSRTVLLQRGVISAVDGATMTVRSLDGWTSTWTLNDATRIREHRATVSASALKVGDTVAVRGPGSGQSGTAAVVRDRGVVTPRTSKATAG